MNYMEKWLFPPSRDLPVEATNLLANKILKDNKYKKSVVLGTWVGCIPITLSDFSDVVVTIDKEKGYDPSPQKVSKINNVNNIDFIVVENKSLMMKQLYYHLNDADLVVIDEWYDSIIDIIDYIKNINVDMTIVVVGRMENLCDDIYTVITDKGENIVFSVIKFKKDLTVVDDIKNVVAETIPKNKKSKKNDIYSTPKEEIKNEEQQ